MRSDGRALPDLTQTLVLRQLGLIRTDQLPDLAARWLAADMTDSPSTRMLAGHNPANPHGCPTSCCPKAQQKPGPPHPQTPQYRSQSPSIGSPQPGATTTTPGSHRYPAGLGETYPDFDLGLFIGARRRMERRLGTTRTRPQGPRRARDRLHPPRPALTRPGLTFTPMPRRGQFSRAADTPPYHLVGARSIMVPGTKVPYITGP